MSVDDDKKEKMENLLGMNFRVKRLLAAPLSRPVRDFFVEVRCASADQNTIVVAGWFKVLGDALGRAIQDHVAAHLGKNPMVHCVCDIRTAITQVRT